MRNRLLAATGSAAAALTLLFAPSASAATEFGDPCVSDLQFPFEEGLFPVSAEGNPLPAVVPAPGVLTAVKVSVEPPGLSVSAPVVIKTLRRDPATGTVLVGGEVSGSIRAESSVFPTRFPVRAGDVLGIFGTSPQGTPMCSAQTEASIGFFNPAVPSGASTPYAEFSGIGIRVPVVGTVEPDADNDGFGDETQDRCPQSAAFQTACPPVTVDTSTVTKKGSVQVLVSVTSTAPVTVSGVAKLGKGKKVTLDAGTQTVTAGKITRFTLKFSKKLKTKLEELRPKQKLTLNITASATNVAGQVSATALSAKLKGQARPAAKR